MLGDEVNTIHLIPCEQLDPFRRVIYLHFSVNYICSSIMRNEYSGEACVGTLQLKECFRHPTLLTRGPSQMQTECSFLCGLKWGPLTGWLDALMPFKKPSLRGRRQSRAGCEIPRTSSWQWAGRWRRWDAPECNDECRMSRGVKSQFTM